MAFRANEPNTRRQIARFSVDEWISFRERLTRIKNEEIISDRDCKILYELIVNQKSTAQLAYLGRTDSNYTWLKSNQNKPISVRRIQQILHGWYPEFHIQTTNKKHRYDQKIRTEAKTIRDKLLAEGGKFCGWCGSTENLDLHHMLPVFLGGTNDSRNLIFLCEKCHQMHTNYVKSIYKYGGGKKALEPQNKKIQSLVKTLDLEG
jgi:5-methylcytosine-specific restriction endonuclease McrA